MDDAKVAEGKKREGSATPDSESDYQFPRRLAVCLDGTWNQRDSGTNIYHLSNLILEGKIAPRLPGEDSGGRDLARKTWVQMVYYDEGVGTGVLDSATGGAFGIGLSENVRQAYDWLVERYREHDQIYIFGFSRGAFTARSLVGMIAKCGLLYRGAPLPPAQLWQGYQLMVPGASPLQGGKTAPAKKWWQPFGSDKQSSFRPMKYLKPTDQDTKIGIKPIPWDKMSETEKLLCQWSRRVPIECLAVYDTVGTFGIEALAIPWLRERRAQFHDTELTSVIQNGFHGLAIDEHRAMFSHIPWHRATELRSKAHLWGPIRQRWFIGAHSNIGGGNKNNTLAQHPLKWFIEECGNLGLVFKPHYDRKGTKHDSEPVEPDVRAATSLKDCLPLLPRRDGKAAEQKSAHVSDSYTEFSRGIWRYLIRAKRNYRRIGPPPEFRNGKEVESLNEELDPSVLELLWADQKSFPGPILYNPPNLYEYLARPRRLTETTNADTATANVQGEEQSGMRDRSKKREGYVIAAKQTWDVLSTPDLEAIARASDAEESGEKAPKEPSRMTLEEPPHIYLDGKAARGWLARWLFAIGWGGGLIAGLLGGGRWYWLAVVLPLVAFLADWAESYFTHRLALAPDAQDAERSDAVLDVLLNIRLAAIGVFLIGAVFFLVTFLRLVLYPMPLSEAAWLLALGAMIIHYRASKTWAAKPMLEANFGSIRKLQKARTPKDVSDLLDEWAKPGPDEPSARRLLPVRRTIWRDIVGFIPAYSIAFGAGVWLTLSLVQRWCHPEPSVPFLALLSRNSWCWVPALVIVGFGALFDIVEDAIHLRYLREYGREPSEKPSKGLVRFATGATWMKVLFCGSGFLGFGAAILGLVLIQLCRFLAHVFPCAF